RAESGTRDVIVILQGPHPLPRARIPDRRDLSRLPMHCEAFVICRGTLCRRVYSAAIRAEDCDTDRRGIGPNRFSDRSTRSDLPELREPVLAPRDEGLAVGADGDTRDRTCVREYALEHRQS